MRVIVTGASGQLGAHMAPELIRVGHEVIAWGLAGSPRGELTDAAATLARLQVERPEAIVHLAAVSTYEAVRCDPARAEAVNVGGTRLLADWCVLHGCRMLFTSTDAVFDGSGRWYREQDEARPIVAYGRSKLRAEVALGNRPGVLVARLSLLYGQSRCGRPGFFDHNLAALRRGDSVAFFEDEYRTPIDYATAARALRLLLESGATGLVHVGGTERLSRFDLMSRAALALGIDPNRVLANRRADVSTPEPRPADTSLDTTRLAVLLPRLNRPSVLAAVAEMERE